MKPFLFFLMSLSSSVTLAGHGRDAILGSGDTFACDSFSRDAKVTCIPGVSSYYRGRVSFPRDSLLILRPYQVYACDQGRDRDVACDTYAGPGPGPGPGPIPPDVRFVDSRPDYGCLRRLPTVDHADQLVSDAFIPKEKLVDQCERTREMREVERLRYRGYSCEVDLSQQGRSDSNCVADLLAKITNQASIKGGHRRRLTNVYCADQIFKCTKQY